jgi:dephospho-CoA kinase
MTQAARPFIIGLTGSIGMGKSAIAAMFEGEGIAVFDADAAVHKLQGPGGALLAEIEAEFPGITSAAGTDRQKLGAAVLGDKARLAKLESIVHPAVARERMAFLEGHMTDDILVFDIPLLFEKGGAETVDAIVVVSAPANTQKARVLVRPGMTAEKFEHILKLQTPDAQKRERADYIIETGGSMEQSRDQVRIIIKKLRNALAQIRN